jgi:ABC-type nitrate/sulfonate/bicarbonate transport system substrate-binding protein
VAKRSFVAANQNDVLAVMRALKKASDWASAQSPRTVSDVLGKYLKTSPEDVAYVIAHNSWKMVDDAAFRGVMHDIEQFLLAQSLIPKKVNWTEAKDQSFLRKIDPALVKGE